MLKKIIIYVFTFIVIVIVILYAIPSKEKSFSEYYDQNDQLKEALLNFREYPTKTIQFNDLDWKYLSIGNGKQHLLFLHGMGGTYDIWFQQIEALKNNYKIISITLPEVNSLEEASAGIIHILDNEKMDKTTIIGTSMGGYIAQYILNTYPERLDRVVLGNTYPPEEQAVNQLDVGNLRTFMPYVPEWYFMSQFRNNLSTNAVPASENSKLVEAYLMEQFSGVLTRAQLIGRYDICVDKFKMDYSNLSERIPLLIIESDNDSSIKESMRIQIKELYPQADVFTFSKKGHFPYLNQPDTYTEVLKNFINNREQE